MIDAHVHLQFAPIVERLDEIMADCRKRGIGRMVCNATRPGDWDAVADIAERHPQVIASFGVHPWFASEASANWEERLRERLVRHSRACVGEIGLDRWVEPRDEAKQETIFRRQLGLGHELGRPTSIHCLRAWGWLMAVLDDRKSVLPPAMLIHSYGGSAELIEPLVRHNAYFSVSGQIFEPRRETLREVCRAIPRDRLLIETDAPDMLPPTERRALDLIDGAGRVVNHPANLGEIYRGVADLLGWEVKRLIEQVRGNARKFLGACF